MFGFVTQKQPWITIYRALQSFNIRLATTELQGDNIKLAQVCNPWGNHKCIITYYFYFYR
jgi:hypothetical protein